MTRERKTERQEGDPLGEIRRGFDGLLGALGAAISDISERLETGQSGEVHRSFEVDTGQGPVRAEAGIRVRFADAAPAQTLRSSQRMARPVNAGKAPDGPRPAPPAEPRPARPIDFEIVEDAGAWRLIADIPGVGEGEVSLAVEHGNLVIETTGARHFRGVSKLPDGIGSEDLELSLRNGILELTCVFGEAADR